MNKSSFEGQIMSIQPRIRLYRSYDERHHGYLGYSLVIRGAISGHGDGAVDNDGMQTFSIGIGKGAQAKHEFKVGDVVSGECVPVADKRLEPVGFYKVAKLKKESPGTNDQAPPPWQIVPPDLDTYRERGHRRLAARTYDTKCSSCIWGCRMPVEITIDNWNPGLKEYRVETFCYGPLSCDYYKPGPNRKIKGRKGMVYVEEDWVDEDATSHRALDE